MYRRLFSRVRMLRNCTAIKKKSTEFYKKHRYEKVVKTACMQKQNSVFFSNFFTNKSSIKKSLN